MEKIAGADLLASVEAEILEAIAWYNEQSEGLGFEFASEIFRTIERISRYPLAWTSLSKRTRRCRTKRFPYGIICQIRKDRILIVSVMHMKREPNSWRSDLPSRKQ